MCNGDFGEFTGKGFFVRVPLAQIEIVACLVISVIPSELCTLLSCANG